ncbi:hypothetical protein Wxf_00047 [Armadillidium vulgare]|nr:hypothetical protein Wxf_00047 [Armadillidium vulgare] [Wolbachia endosymbiont of Armadillidium vulgare]
MRFLGKKATGHRKENSRKLSIDSMIFFFFCYSSEALKMADNIFLYFNFGEKKTKGKGQGKIAGGLLLPSLTFPLFC